MKGYDIIDIEKIDTHITFIRINPYDITLTLKQVFESLSNISWISSFDEEYLQSAFKIRAEASIDYIANKIIKCDDDSVTSNSGEYVISELARMSILNLMNYLDIPLAELIKIKDVGNHGFDFYTKNKNDILLFGEAKYLSRDNAYGSALKQIVRFEKEKQDSSDIIDIDRFCCETSKTNFSKGKKGFIAAFAAKSISTEKLIENIKENEDFKLLVRFQELICIAVNI